MDDTRDVSQNREQDVDEQIGAAATLEEDSQGREEDGKNDLEDVAVGRNMVSTLKPAGRIGGERNAALPSGERHDCSWWMLVD